MHTHTHTNTPDCPGGQGPAGGEDRKHRAIVRAAQQFEDSQKKEELRKALSIISSFLSYKFILAGK